MEYNDFDGEFQPIKEISKEEASTDKLVNSLKRYAKEADAEKRRKLSDLQFFKNFKKITKELDAKAPQAPQDTARFTSEELEHAYELKSILRRQLLRRKDTQSQAYHQLKSVVRSTIVDNEGNSVIVVGPRGSGKTTLVNTVLDEFSQDHGDQFIVIRLNSMVQSDNASAVRQIGFQLDKALSKFPPKDMNVKVETRSLTVTFKSILRLLDDSSEDKADFSVIFVMEEIESFTADQKQVLLYNLFELSVSSAIPICIIGTTVKFSTRDLLEKRVRSRFSQRLIVLNKPNSLEDFKQICVSNLTINPSNGPSAAKSLLQKWNKSIEKSADDKTSKLSKLIERHFYTSKSTKKFNTDCLIAVNKLDNNTISFEDSLGVLREPFQNPVEAIFESLSDLESLLLVAAARFITKSEMSAINFNIAYKEYEEMLNQLNVETNSLGSSSSAHHNSLTSFKISNKIWSATIMRNCWNTLYRMGIILDHAANTAEGGQLASNTNKYFVVDDTKMLQVDINLSELNLLFDETSAYKRLTRL